MMVRCRSLRLGVGLGRLDSILGHQHADLVAVGDGNAEAPVPACFAADQAEVHLGIVQPDVEHAVSSLTP